MITFKRYQMVNIEINEALTRYQMVNIHVEINDAFINSSEVDFREGICPCESLKDVFHFSCSICSLRKARVYCNSKTAAKCEDVRRFITLLWVLFMHLI